MLFQESVVHGSDVVFQEPVVVRGSDVLFQEPVVHGSDVLFQEPVVIYACNIVV